MKNEKNIIWHFWYYLKEKIFWKGVLSNFKSLLINGILPFSLNILFLFIFNFSASKEVINKFVVFGLISTTIISLVLSTYGCFDKKSDSNSIKAIVFAVLCILSTIEAILCILIDLAPQTSLIACCWIIGFLIPLFVIYYLMCSIDYKSIKKETIEKQKSRISLSKSNNDSGYEI